MMLKKIRYTFPIGIAISACTLVCLSTSARAIEVPDVDGPDNFWECILDKMPGVRFTVEYNKRLRECQKEFPDNEPIEKDTRGEFRIFGDDTVKECVAKNTVGTPSRRAKYAIRRACLATKPKS